MSSVPSSQSCCLRLVDCPGADPPFFLFDLCRKLWDVRTGDEMASFTHNHVVRSAILSKDEIRLFTGGQEKKLRIFDVERPAGISSLF